MSVLAVGFDADADYLQGVDLPTDRINYTVSFWYNPADATNDGQLLTLVDTFGGFHAVEMSASGVIIHDNFGNSASAKTLVNGTPYFIAITSDAALNLKVWVKAQADVGFSTATKAGYTADMPWVTSNFAGYTGFGSGVNGAVCLVRVWNRALSEAELLSEAASATPASTVSLIGSYPMAGSAAKLTASVGTNLTAPDPAGAWTDGVGPTFGTIYSETPADVVVSVDAVASSASLVSSLQDLVVSSDLLTSAQAQGESLVDTAVSVDTLFGTASFVAAISDAVVSTDALSSLQAQVAALFDVAVSADTAASMAAFVSSIADVAVTSDALVASQAQVAAFASVAVSSSTLASTQSQFELLSDTALVLDSVVLGGGSVYAESLTSIIICSDSAHSSQSQVETVVATQQQSRPLVMKLQIPTGLVEAKGIHQSDVIIRTAIIAALADMRANPRLLDYVFSSLPQDVLTNRQYGEREVANAKNWFLKNDIPVFMNTRLEESALPCISIGLMEASEAETTLADVHYETKEDSYAEWPDLSNPFTPEYNVPTGIMILGKDVTDVVAPAVGMFVIDGEGKPHEILEVLDASTVAIAANTQGRFVDCTIRGAKPSVSVELESVNMKETYSIGCHVAGEPLLLAYLYSIVLFALYRYKQALLEARGLERTTVGASDVRHNAETGVENAWSRWITLTGYVRQYWPKAVMPNITSVQSTMVVTGAGNVPKDTNPLDVAWIGDQDALDLKL